MIGTASAATVGSERGAGSSVRVMHKVLATAILLAGAISLSLVLPGYPTPLHPPPTASPDAPGIDVVSPQAIDLPDPMLVAEEGRYHLYLSTAFGDMSRSNVPEMAGTPGRWGRPFDAMPSVPGWAVGAARGGKTWDPYVAKVGPRYLLYFAAELDRPGRKTHCLGAARSDSLDGPFVPVPGPPLVCQLDHGGDIDSQPFYDPTGPNGPSRPWYLIWKSDDNNLRPTPRPTSIWAAPLANDGSALSGPARVIYRGELPWQRPLVEAPQMVRSPDGRTWLFFSAGKFFTPQYSIGVAACDGPLGGCHPAIDRPLVSTNRQGPGPGEETVFVGPDRSYWLLYNPWHTGLPFMLYRPAEAVRIGWGRAGPYVAEAGTFPWPYHRVAHPR